VHVNQLNVGTVPTPATPPSAPPVHPGDRDKATRLLASLPLHVSWLTTLRTHDFIVVSGVVNKLFLNAADVLENDPIWFVDPELHNAEAACRQAARQLRNTMLSTLVVDRIDEQAAKRLPLSQQNDAVVLVIREGLRGTVEPQLYERRDAFFEAYDVLVRLLNQRLMLPGQPAASPGTSATTVEGEAVRAAGAGAHHNAFGDRSSVKGHAQAPTVADEHPGSRTVVRSNRNRVAGEGAHNNVFGDDSRVENE
jgi:hypothetical protein